MNWLRTWIALLSVSCLSQAQVSLMDGCPEAQEDAERCQRPMRKVMVPMLVMKKPLSEKEKIKMCCNVAHAINCLVTEAFPKCNEHEKEALFEQTKHFLRDSTFSRNRLFNMSCARFEFHDHQFPGACEGHVDGYPVRSHFIWTIVEIAGAATLSVTLIVMFLACRFRSYKLVKSNMRVVSEG